MNWPLLNLHWLCMRFILNLCKTFWSGERSTHVLQTTRQRDYLHHAITWYKFLNSRDRSGRTNENWKLKRVQLLTPRYTDSDDQSLVLLYAKYPWMWTRRFTIHWFAETSSPAAAFQHVASDHIEERRDKMSVQCMTHASSITVMSQINGLKIIPVDHMSS